MPLFVLESNTPWRNALNFIANVVCFLQTVFLHAPDAFVCRRTDSISSFFQDSVPVYRHDATGLIQNLSTLKRWSDLTLVDRPGPCIKHRDNVVEEYVVDLSSARDSLLAARGAGILTCGWEPFYDGNSGGDSELPKIPSSSPPPRIRRWTGTRVAFRTGPKHPVSVNSRTWAFPPSRNGASPPLQLELKEPAASSAPETTSISNTLKSQNWNWSGNDHIPSVRSLICVSSNIVLSPLLEYHAKAVVSASETQDEKGSKQQRGRSGHQTPSESRCNSRKRKSDSSGDDRDDEGDKQSPKRSRPDSKSPATASVLPLACPFNKYDSRLFGPSSPDESYHVCATCSFVTIAHLKQHLKRNHYLPVNYCQRCCKSDFSSQATLELHYRERPQCQELNPPRYRERIGSDLIEKLGLDRKNLPGTDRVEYWYTIYDTLFPSHSNPRPSSPYYNDPEAENLHRFLRFSDKALEEVIPAVQQKFGFHDLLEPNSQLRLVREIQQETGRQYLRHIADSKMPYLGHSVSETNRNANYSVTVQSNSQSLTSPAAAIGDGFEGTVLEKSRKRPQLVLTHTDFGGQATTSDNLSPSLSWESLGQSNLDSTLQLQEAQFRHHRSGMCFESAEGSDIQEPSTCYYCLEDLGPSEIFGRWPFKAGIDVLTSNEVDC